MTFLQYLVGTGRCSAGAHWYKFSCNSCASGANLVLSVRAPTWEGGSYVLLQPITTIIFTSKSPDWKNT